MDQQDFKDCLRAVAVMALRVTAAFGRLAAVTVAFVWALHKVLQ